LCADFFRARLREHSAAAGAVRALPLPIPVAYGVKRQKAAICAKAGDKKAGLANRIRGKISDIYRRARSKPTRA